MRVISGSLKGRNFTSPNTSRTHPMSDKIRGALFNTLGDIDGLTVLDPFAGSGAVSFEAISRGAASALLIEADKPAQQAIEQSIRDLHVQTVAKLIKANCSSWSDTNPAQQLDLVLADPPYDNVQMVVLGKLVRHVVPGGLFVLSFPGSESLPTFDGCELIVNKTYGDARLLFYRAADV